MIYLLLIFAIIILTQSFFNMLIWGSKNKITRKKIVIAINKTILQIILGWCLVNNPFIKNTI